MKLLWKLGDALDDLRSIFNPKGAALRKMQRRSYFGGYDAAFDSRKNSRYGAMSNNAPAEVVNKPVRDILRGKARNLEMNSPLINSVIQAFLHNVVGKGFNMQAMSDNNAFNDRIEKLWRYWCHHENCDYTRKQSLDDLVKLVLRRMLIDGGILATFPLDTTRTIPLTIQLHEVDELDSTDISVPGKDHILSGGVEMTRTGIPVAYYLHEVYPDGMVVNAVPVRFDAKDVCFLWRKTRVSQFREISELSSVIENTQDLEDYANAVAFQQKTQACMAVYVETDNVVSAPGRMANTKDGKRIEDIEGGTVNYLRPGEHAKFLIPTGQAAEANTYIPLQQRNIAAALGLSLESTSRNVEKVNYSSARQNLLVDNVTYDDMRGFLVEYFLRPLYKRFVNICYLTGMLDGTGFDANDPSYYEAVWLTSSLGWIDPKKEAEADNIDLANGGISFQEYCAKQGADWRDRIDQMAEVHEYAQSKGVNLAFETNAIQVSGDDGEEEDDDGSNQSD